MSKSRTTDPLRTPQKGEIVEHWGAGWEKPVTVTPSPKPAKSRIDSIPTPTPKPKPTPTPTPSMSKKQNTKPRGGFISPYIFVVLIAIAVAVIQTGPAIESMTGPRATTKPFTTFHQFYPHYLSEHSDLMNRRLHFTGTTIFLLLGLYYNASVYISMSAALSVGFFICPLTAGLEHGLMEGVIMLLTGLLTQFLISRRVKPFIVVLLIGYGFAWVGHFMFEKNRPATFIYPAYSLLSDFKTWLQVVKQELPLGLEIGGVKF